MLCELWPRPVETTHLLYPHRPVGSHSYCCTTFLKKVRADHTKVGNCTPNSYARRVKRSFLEFTRVTFSPVAKILLVYGSRGGSEPHRYSEEHLQQESVPESPHLWLCGWHDLSHLILEPASLCKDAGLNRHAESSSNLISPVPWHAYERNAIAIAEWMLLLLSHFLAL